MKKKLLIILIPLLLIAAVVGGYFGVEAAIMAKAPDPAQAAAALLEEIINEAKLSQAETEAGNALLAAANECLAFEINGEPVISRREATVPVTLRFADTESLEEKMPAAAQTILEATVEEAKLSSEVYNSDKSFKAEVLESASRKALEAVLPELESSEAEIEIKLSYKKGEWHSEDGEFIKLKLGLYNDCDAIADGLCAKAVENPQYVQKIYTIEENAKAAPVPSRENFGSTTDPAVIEELLKRPEAQSLIKGQKLVWNKDIELIPGTEIRYYLDESILCLVWQEEEALAVGTFSEVFIADGSQIRRKIAGDRYESFEFAYATQLAADTNAVLAVGGDLYHHGRNCGIMVYERDVYRYDMTTCDICYIDSEGDMVFSYRNQFSSQAEVDAFVEENDALFSISFGPVLVDNGVDVTPNEYQWGEINDTYARAALGMLGDKHYLTMNINCQKPDHFYLATLRQAADAMIERGCIKAYTLDGGQTASTVFDGVLINPVQFGTERLTSDILYFASAVPEN